MIINLSIPLTFTRSSLYLFVSIVTLFLVLLPWSMISYFRFRSTLIPNNIPDEFLKFKYFTSKQGSFCLFSLSKLDLPNLDIDQSISLDLKYEKLGSLDNSNELLGIKMSFLNGNQLNELKTILTSEWPFIQFKKINKFESNLSWEELALKLPYVVTEYIPVSCTTVLIEQNLNQSIFEYFLPHWMISLLFPTGLVKLFSVNNFKKVLSRLPVRNQTKEFQVEMLKIIDGIGETANNDMWLLIELNNPKVFIVEGKLIINYCFEGIKWWVYWWPGLCFIIGTGIFWLISSVFCLSVSWFGMFLINWKNDETNVSNNVEKNLNKLVNN